MSGLASARVLERTDWSPGLMTLTISETAEFTPGQFFNLAIKQGETVLRRSYSAASAPGQPLQFILSQVSAGQLTPSLFDLGVGSEILVDVKALGFFTLNEVPETERLWLVATGTGLGPYLSMLRSGALASRFLEIVIVHGVRTEEHLAHRGELSRAALAARIKYIPVLSSEPPYDPAHTASSPLAGRITQAWDSGTLEAVAGAFDQNCHMLLCGNPQMIDDMSTRLNARGFEKHRRRQAGHYNFEKYW